MADFYDLNANVSFKYQTIKNLYALPTYLHFGKLCKFFGDFWVYLRINSFSQTISKIDGNRESGRFDVVLKFEFTFTKLELSTNLGCPFGVNQLSGSVPIPIFIT